MSKEKVKKAVYLPKELNNTVKGFLIKTGLTFSQYQKGLTVNDLIKKGVLKFNSEKKIKK